MFGIPSLGYKFTGISVLGQAQGLLWDFIENKPRLGVFKDGEPVLEIDTVYSITTRSSAQVSDYPVMAGGFSTYNKVTHPLSHQITMVTANNKEELLKWLEENQSAATKWDINTPEKLFKDVTLVDYLIRRDPSSKTYSMMMVDCSFLEVKEAPVVYTSSETGQSIQDAQNKADQDAKPTTFVQKVAYDAKRAKEAIDNTVGDITHTIESQYAQLKEISQSEWNAIKDAFS